MRILLLNQFFWPDSAATSQFVTDLARYLAEEGHAVTAICGRGGYAQLDSGARPSVHIERLPEFPFGRSLSMRALSYLSFFAFAAWRTLSGNMPDLVVTLTTPPLISLLGSLLQTTLGVRHIIWEMDLYPDVAVDLNYLRPNSIFTKVIGLIADYSRHRSDGIIALGECMRDRLLARGIRPDKIQIAQNWADGTEIRAMPFPSRGRLTLLYSGNLGLAHDVETIRAAIRQLRKDPRFSFIFAGGGRKLQDFAGAPNVTVRPYCARSELSASLAEGDIGVVLQRDQCIGSVVPSKTYGIMAAGRPILFIGPRLATPGRIIDRHRCGWQIDCGDTASLIELLNQVVDHPNLVHEAGRRAREAFEEHYDRPIGVARIARILGLPTAAPSPEQSRAIQADRGLVGGPAR